MLTFSARKENPNCHNLRLDVMYLLIAVQTRVRLLFIHGSHGVVSTKAKIFVSILTMLYTLFI